MKESKSEHRDRKTAKRFRSSKGVILNFFFSKKKRYQGSKKHTQQKGNKIEKISKHAKKKKVKIEKNIIFKFLPT